MKSLKEVFCEQVTDINCNYINALSSLAATYDIDRESVINKACACVISVANDKKEKNR